MTPRYFHFTLSPVQSFVAQARRTRDFWAGSFILSYLSAVAMKAVEKQGGTILFPAANERFLAWLEDSEKAGTTTIVAPKLRPGTRSAQRSVSGGSARG